MPSVIIFSAVKPSYVVEENTTAVSWSKELVIEIPFSISKELIEKSKVTVHFDFLFDVRSEEWRSNTVKCTFILNGKEIRFIREDFEGTWLKGAGSYPETIIKHEMLKEENHLVIKVNILQKGVLESKSYFKLQIERPYVRVSFIDSDKDSIYDMVDPFPRLSNSLIVGIFGIIGMPISIIMDKAKIDNRKKEITYLPIR